MKAFACDRCGNYYSKDDITSWPQYYTRNVRLCFQSNVDASQSDYVDLCPECKADFVVFWKVVFVKEKADNQNG